MKRLLKKNQIIITTLAVLIAVAGYLNYSGKLFGKSGAKTEETTADLANKELLDISEEDMEAGNKDIESNDSESEGQTEEMPDGTPGDSVLTSSEVAATVAQAKVEREQVRSQNKETLQAIIDNQNLTDEQKQDAVNRLVKMTELAEQEMDIETLLSSKGFSESVVNLTENSADIVVKSKELTDANRAQIEDIVTRKTEISPENIVITPIGK